MFFNPRGRKKNRSAYVSSRNERAVENLLQEGSLPFNDLKIAYSGKVPQGHLFEVQRSSLLHESDEPSEIICMEYEGKLFAKRIPRRKRRKKEQFVLPKSFPEERAEEEFRFNIGCSDYPRRNSLVDFIWQYHEGAEQVEITITGFPAYFLRRVVNLVHPELKLGSKKGIGDDDSRSLEERVNLLAELRDFSEKEETGDRELLTVCKKRHLKPSVAGASMKAIRTSDKGVTARTLFNYLLSVREEEREELDMNSFQKLAEKLGYPLPSGVLLEVTTEIMLQNYARTVEISRGF